MYSLFRTFLHRPRENNHDGLCSDCMAADRVVSSFRVGQNPNCRPILVLATFKDRIVSICASFLHGLDGQTNQ